MDAIGAGRDEGKEGQGCEDAGVGHAGLDLATSSLSFFGGKHHTDQLHDAVVAGVQKNLLPEKDLKKNREQADSAKTGIQLLKVFIRAHAFGGSLDFRNQSSRSVQD